MNQIRVLIADDQQLLRHSLRIIVDAAEDLTCIGTAATGHEALQLASQLQPDVVLMDIRMPELDGITATARLTSAAPTTRVLILTMFELDEYVYHALRAGASGFLLKDATPEVLTDAIRRTHAGESLFAPSVLARLVSHFVGHQPTAPTTDHLPLTPREVEVLTLVGQGLSNDEIAQRLVISIKTVKTHIGSLLSKLHSRDRAQLVIAAYDAGLVTPRTQ